MRHNISDFSFPFLEFTFLRPEDRWNVLNRGDLIELAQGSPLKTKVYEYERQRSRDAESAGFIKIPKSVEELRQMLEEARDTLPREQKIADLKRKAHIK